jgi:hypothetical protein
MGSILNVYAVHQKDMHEFVQHLKPRASIGNNSVVFPPHVRSVKKHEYQLPPSLPQPNPKRRVCPRKAIPKKQRRLLREYRTIDFVQIRPNLPIYFFKQPHVLTICNHYWLYKEK